MKWVGAPLQEERLRVCSTFWSLVMCSVKNNRGFPSLSCSGEGGEWPGPFRTLMHSAQCSRSYNVMTSGALLMLGKARIRVLVAQLLL